VFFGEVIWAANLDRALLPADPIASGRDLREFGWVVGASQEFTSWVAFGVRYDFYNPDVDAYRQTPTVIVPKERVLSHVDVHTFAGRLCSQSFDAGIPTQPQCTGRGRGWLTHDPGRGHGNTEGADGFLMRCRAGIWFLPLAVAGCGGAASDTGLQAAVRVTGGQFLSRGDRQTGQRKRSRRRGRAE